jgi:hypothetical protein
MNPASKRRFSQGKRSPWSKTMSILWYKTHSAVREDEAIVEARRAWEE